MIDDHILSGLYMAFNWQPMSHLPPLSYYLVWLRVYFWSIPLVIARRCIHKSPLSLWQDIRRTRVRSFFNGSEYHHLRLYAGSPRLKAAAVLETKRFSPFRNELYQKVIKPMFSGYWVIQGDIKSAQDPANSHVVLYFIHGGGYVAYSVANFLAFLVAVWESTNAINPDIRFSIFALEYNLAPELQFPGQLQEVAAAYDYLVSDVGIDPRRIIISGDSAGGHLVISLLKHLKTPHPDVSSMKRQKPDAALLITPWLDPYSSRAAHSIPLDILDSLSLAYWANLFHSYPLECSNPLDLSFLRPLKYACCWEKVLPSRCTITTGSDDSFLASCVEFRDKVSGDGLKINLEVEERGVHDWQWLEVNDDQDRYVHTSREERSEWDFKGAKQLARIIMETLEITSS